MGPEPFEIYRDDYIKVLCMDEKGAGGAHHRYHVYLAEADETVDEPLSVIEHQQGPILENGVNGLTNEALLAIVEHRLNCFQSGPFPSHYNAAALHGVEFSKAVLHVRTAERKSRGVEGKNQV